MLLIGFLFQLIGFGAPHWSQTDASTIRREHFGLWKYCTYPIGGNQHCDDFINLASIGDWLKVVQGFMTMALFTHLVSIGITFMVAFVEELADDMRVYGAAIGATATTVVFMVVGITTFGVKRNEYFNNREDAGIWKNVAIFDWAYYIAITACILVTLAGITLLLKLILPDDLTFGEESRGRHSRADLKMPPQYAWSPSQDNNEV